MFTGLTVFAGVNVCKAAGEQDGVAGVDELCDGAGGETKEELDWLTATSADCVGVVWPVEAAVGGAKADGKRDGDPTNRWASLASLIDRR